MAETPAQRRRRVQKERREAGRASRQQGRWRRAGERIVRAGRPIGVAVLVVAIVAGAWFVTGRERRAAAARLGDAVVSERSQGRAHTPSTTADAAPTSGAHSGPPVCGVLSRPLGPDSQIHSLEHGSVLFQYRPTEVTDDDIEALDRLAHEFPSHVTVAPNPRLSQPFVATAWTKRMELPGVDVDRARDFARAFRERGPERVPCDV